MGGSADNVGKTAPKRMLAKQPSLDREHAILKKLLHGLDYEVERLRCSRVAERRGGW